MWRQFALQLCAAPHNAAAMKLSVCFAFIALLTFIPSVWAEVFIKSPSQKVSATVSAGADGRVVYSVASDGKTVLSPSPLGLIVDGRQLGAAATFGEITKTRGHESFSWRGSKSHVTENWRGAVIPVTDANGITWRLEMRCFDDGVAYRCVVPGKGPRQVSGESAAWTFPEGTFAWAQPNTDNYEGVHLRRAVNQLATNDFPKGIGMPVTFELPGGGFAALTEANIMGYSGMTLAFDGSWSLKAEFRDDPKGWEMSDEIVTPWRVLMVADDLNGLVNCDIVPALCPAPNAKLFPRGMKTAWLKPGRMLWQWWAYDDPGTHWSKQKGFVDAAAALNCQYYLVDEGWEHSRQEWASDGKDVWARLKELCDYAATKNVGIWVWRGWTFNEKRQWPGLETREKQEEFFRRCAEVGVKGAKVDFMDNESHNVLAFYEDCTRAAAKYKVMINFHGANKPAGEPRTWPNEMTREGIRGLEYNKWDTLPPEHYATLPFTRYLAGHGDFTPTTFQPDKLKGTTFGGQLAVAVVYTSPVLCWADRPGAYLTSPAVDLIRTLPTTWDETRVLPGSKIGEVAAFARRSGKDWYVGVIAGPQACDYTLDLSFLGRGHWQADYFNDAKGTRTRLEVQRNRAVTAETQETLQLPAGGGFVVHIRK